VAGKLQRSRKPLARHLVRLSFSENGSFSGGGNFYRAVFQGNKLVYVTAQPK
jgi:hypothetical protein